LSVIGSKNIDILFSVISRGPFCKCWMFNSFVLRVLFEVEPAVLILHMFWNRTLGINGFHKWFYQERVSKPGPD